MRRGVDDRRSAMAWRHLDPTARCSNSGLVEQIRSRRDMSSTTNLLTYARGEVSADRVAVPSILEGFRSFSPLPTDKETQPNIRTWLFNRYQLVSYRTKNVSLLYGFWCFTLGRSRNDDYCLIIVITCWKFLWFHSKTFDECCQLVSQRIFSGAVIVTGISCARKWHSIFFPFRLSIMFLRTWWLESRWGILFGTS